MTVLAPQEKDWTKEQERLTRASGNLTAAGAVALGGLMAGKTKAARKVIPKKLHKKLSSEKADDVRNSIALASMVTGALSARKWANKMRDDVAVTNAVESIDQANNLAKAIGDDVFKGIIPSAIVRYPSGISRTRAASFRRGSKMLRPRRRYI